MRNISLRQASGRKSSRTNLLLLPNPAGTWRKLCADLERRAGIAGGHAIL